MTAKLPALSSRKLVAILRRRGFEPVRQSGSHMILRHPDGQRVTVPVHKGRDVGKGLLRRIMKDAGLTVEELKD